MRPKQWNDLFAIEKDCGYESHLKETITLVHKEADRLNISVEPTLTLTGLVKKQLKFFAWKIWLFQGMVLAALCSLFFSTYTVNINQWLLDTLPKFLCLCSAVIAMSSIPILKRTFRYQMFELEQSTHFSMNGSLLSQLLFIGIGDLLMLAVLTIIVAGYGLTLSVTIVSLFIPFMTALSSCLMLWVRTTPSYFQTMGILLCLLSSWLGYIIVDRGVKLQPKAQLCLWIGYLLLFISILYHEYRRLARHNAVENKLS